MKFYEKLQKIRKEKGFSQEQLAETLNVSRQAVSKWESGTSYPETEKLIELSKLFDTSIDSLLKEEIEPIQNDQNQPITKTIEIDSEEEKEYLDFTKKFALRISIGVDLCILSVIIFLLTNPIYISLILILPAIILFVDSGISYTGYEDIRIKYLKYKIVDKKVKKRFRKIFAMAITTGVSVIFIGLLATIAFQNKFELLLLSTLIAVPLFIYYGILSENYKIFDKEIINTNKNEMIIGKLSGIIMITATIVFLISGFIYDAWHPMWIIYPICGMLCGIISIIFSNENDYK